MRAFAALLVPLALVGCTYTQVVNRPTLPPTAAGQLDPTERLLATREPAERPLPVVTNDSPAGDRFLRTPARPLDPSAPGVTHLLRRMRAALREQQGVGIAAPQVGISRRVILAQRFDAVGHRRGACDETRCPVRAYFNPVILKLGGERKIDWEGCLSIPAGFGKVSRATEIVLAYQDEQGLSHEERVPGFTARILQHEIDHLAGTLFIDLREPGKLLDREAYRRMREKERGQSASRPVGD